MAAVPTANARAFLLVRNANNKRFLSLVRSSIFDDDDDDDDIRFDRFLWEQSTFGSSSHNFGLSFCPFMMCFSSLFSRVQIDVLSSSNSCCEEARSSDAWRIYHSQRCFAFFFPKGEKKKRTLLGSEMEELLTNLSSLLLSLAYSITLSTKQNKTKQNSTWANSNRIAADWKASLKTTSRRRYQSPRSISADTLRFNR